MIAREALYDLARAGGARSIVVVGTAKNVGKTTTVDALLRVADERGATVGLTSIGRDGEAFDAVDGQPKPRLFVRPRTIVATAHDLLPPARVREMLGEGARSALGRIGFFRLREPMFVEIAGPPVARDVRATIARLIEYGADPVLVDGAIDRIAAIAGGNDAVIVATGAALAASPAEVVAHTASLIARLRLPAPDPHRARLAIVTTLGADRLAALVAAGERRQVVARDPTRILVRGEAFMHAARALDLRVRHTLEVVACTVAPAGEGRAFDARALVDGLADATGLPVFDVVAGLSSG